MNVLTPIPPSRCTPFEASAVHLTVTTGRDGRSVDLQTNDDLGQVLGAARGALPAGAVVPAYDTEDAGLVVLRLGAGDEAELDEIQLTSHPLVDVDELLDQAIAALTTCREGLRSVARDGRGELS